MASRPKEDPEDDDDQEDPGLEDIELEEVTSAQFPPTSLKILDLNNPLRRHCINIILSPWVLDWHLIITFRVFRGGEGGVYTCDCVF